MNSVGQTVFKFSTVTQRPVGTNPPQRLARISGKQLPTARRLSAELIGAKTGGAAAVFVVVADGGALVVLVVVVAGGVVEVVVVVLVVVVVVLGVVGAAVVLVVIVVIVVGGVGTVVVMVVLDDVAVVLAAVLVMSFVVIVTGVDVVLAVVDAAGVAGSEVVDAVVGETVGATVTDFSRSSINGGKLLMALGRPDLNRLNVRSGISFVSSINLSRRRKARGPKKSSLPLNRFLLMNWSSSNSPASAESNKLR